MNYETFFAKIANHEKPYKWQINLATANDCANRLIRIPTGFGKTLGVLSTWLFHRLQRNNEQWPRRLVWCLPMRVLVEQTEQVIRDALGSLGLLWEEGMAHSGRVGVHLLMGGVGSGEWHLHPEHCAVLIGTQDMLLSRAMNRGYASPRARWPMEFGLLNQDCLWVMDEVQLMDVGLATSAQLQAFRSDDENSGKSPRPCFTWWMSATLQRRWLTKSPDTTEMTESLPQSDIPAEGRTGRLWDDVSKACRLETIKDEKDLAALIAREHELNGFGAAGITLVVLNTVDRAAKAFQTLKKEKALKDQNTEIRLIHSRFRPAERSAWRQDILHRGACAPGTNRIIISTQVVEAGVDISAAVLISELAPWASLVQRFGRCARWGGAAKIVVADLMAGMASVALENAKAKHAKAQSAGKKPKPLDEDELVDSTETKAAMPYGLAETRAARTAVERLSNVAPIHLEDFEEKNQDLLQSLYPFEPKHLLLRHELNELFDTSPDLSGADIDISRFIRSGEERDLHIFWSEVSIDGPGPDLRPVRDALCAVPFLKAREWLCGKKRYAKSNGMRAWVWDWLAGQWRAAEMRDLFPGQTVMVANDCGGYDPLTGWDPENKKTVKPVDAAKPLPAELADASQDDESMSALHWQTIAVHGRQTGIVAKAIAESLPSDHAMLFEIAGRWHDAGKVHPAFNNSIAGDNRPSRNDLAKAPKSAWLPAHQLYPMDGESRRAGFRHEIASVLCLMEVLKRHNPDHEALLGPWRELLQAAGMAEQVANTADRPPSALEKELLTLNAEQFNMVAYLICAHHGKVRLAWHACPADQAAGDHRPRIRGLREGDLLPPLTLVGPDNSFHLLPQITLNLSLASAGLSPRTGPSWTERVLTLLKTHGPFVLAWLEALMRAADQRASRMIVPDELLEQEVDS